MIQAFVDEVPVYATLPREQLEGEILAICERNLRLFFGCLADQRVPNASELAELRTSAMRRAEERVPLQGVISAYHLGGRIGWEAMVAEAATGEHDELLAHAGWLLRYLEVVTATVGAAYLEEQQLIFGEERDARRAFTDALLADQEDVGEGLRRDRLLVLAGRAGVALAEDYLAVATRLGPSADETTAGVSQVVAGRRKVRRLVDRLEQMMGASVLSLLDPGGGLLLVPVPSADIPDLLERCEPIAAELGSAADADVLLAMAWRPGWVGVAAAAAEAREVLRIAARLGATRGAFTARQVLLEQALTISPGHSGRLAQLLDPLATRPQLLATLEAWFDSDFDRQDTARALHVHPNTVDYRLARIAEATGVQPGTARGLQLLGAALVARRVR